MHEGVRVLLNFLAYFRVLLQVCLQVRMALHELLVVYERRVLPQLFCRFAMAIEKFVEVGQFSARCVAISTIFRAIETVFLPHERFWTFLYFLANLRMLLQVRLQRRMAFQKFLVVYQRRIFAQLFGRFPMAIEKLVERR